MSIGTQRKCHPQSLRWITLDPDEATNESLGVSEKTVRCDHAGLPDLGVAIEEHACRHGLKTYSLSHASIGNVPMPLRIRFRGSAVRNSAERKINVMQTEPPDPGGSLDASVTLTRTIEIKSDILSFGSAADVIDPESHRTKVPQEPQQGTTHYTTDTPSSLECAASTTQ